MSDCIFEIHQLWQSGFSRVYSNCYYSCSFKREIIKNCQSSHKMYSNNIVNFQESTTNLNACTKQVWKLIECITYIYMIISKQLGIKQGPFTLEELDSVLRKIKNRKATGLNEIPPEIWKTRQFDDILLRHCNAVYDSIDIWMKGCILPFPKKKWPRISQELPRYNTDIHSCQNIQCPTTQSHRTKNWQHS